MGFQKFHGGFNFASQQSYAVSRVFISRKEQKFKKTRILISRKLIRLKYQKESLFTASIQLKIYFQLLRAAPYLFYKVKEDFSKFWQYDSNKGL